jgi:hypothetical protein
MMQYTLLRPKVHPALRTGAPIGRDGRPRRRPRIHALEMQVLNVSRRHPLLVRSMCVTIKISSHENELNEYIIYIECCGYCLFFKYTPIASSAKRVGRVYIESMHGLNSFIE